MVSAGGPADTRAQSASSALLPVARPGPPAPGKARVLEGQNCPPCRSLPPLSVSQRPGGPGPAHTSLGPRGSLGGPTTL
eukprot:4282868-Heterocapsa_arctica.AAC.1